MNIPCQQAIGCDPGTQAQGYDFPVANFSSEAPDANIFIGVNYGWGNNVPPLGTVWATPGCTAWCYSTTSQDEADLCAAQQQILCLTDNPPGAPVVPGTVSPPGGGPSDPNIPAKPSPPGAPPPANPTAPLLYPNSLQQCGYQCPDGSTYYGYCQAGEVTARGQELANQIAYSLACQRASANRICFGTISPTACLGVPYDEILSVTFGPGVKGPVTFSGSGGGGINVSSADPAFPNSASLYGTPTATGNISISITATSANGITNTKTFTINVLGITTTSLANGTFGTVYSQPLVAQGGVAPYTFATDGTHSLPTGLTISAGGVLTGTPTQLWNDNVYIVVTDANGSQCLRVFPLVIVGIGSQPQTAQCPGQTGVTATMPANSYGVPPGTPNGQDIANNKALAAATNLLAALGCQCSTTNNHQSDYNSNPATMSQASGFTSPASICGNPLKLTMQEFHNGLPGAIGNFSLDPNTTYTLFDMYNSAYGAFIGPGTGNTYKITPAAGGSLVASFST